MSPPHIFRKKVLAYLFGSLGDTLVAIPALRAVRRSFSDAEIVLLQNNSLGGTVQASEVIPGELVDRYLNYEAGTDRLSKVGEYFRLWRSIRRERFDAAVYLVISERTSSSVKRDKHFFRSCGIEQLFGFHSYDASELYPKDAHGRPAATEHEALRKLRRLERDGISVSGDADMCQPTIRPSAEDLTISNEWMEKNRKKPLSKLVAIAPGCKTKTNQWPIERFRELGRRLIGSLDREIVIVGGPSETEMGDALTASWGEGINAAGAFSVSMTSALLSHCDEYVGLDTGTTHLAAAVGLPCFCLYGERNNPGHWFPLGVGHTILRHRVECAGCRKFECPIEGHPCMNGIDIESAWTNFQKYADRTAGNKNQEPIVVEV